MQLQALKSKQAAATNMAVSQDDLRLVAII
jgi:hypothetical protein